MGDPVTCIEDEMVGCNISKCPDLALEVQLMDIVSQCPGDVLWEIQLKRCYDEIAGDINALSTLTSLTRIDLRYDGKVYGNFKDLANLERLEHVYLHRTA